MTKLAVTGRVAGEVPGFVPEYVKVARAYLAECAVFAVAERGKLEVSFKGGDMENVLTHVDVANSARAKRMLAPFGAIIDEESLPVGTPEAFCMENGAYWVVDPIDGTRPFKEGKASWGIMVTRYESGVAVYAGIVMPEMNLQLELTVRDAFITYGESQHSMAVERDLPIAAGSLVNLTPRSPDYIKLVEERMGFTNVYAPSAAEMTLSLAKGEIAMMSLPDKAGFWDAAPAMMLAARNGYVAFFKSSPETLVTVGPAMFKADWTLIDDLVITAREVYALLYPQYA